MVSRLIPALRFLFIGVATADELTMKRLEQAGALLLELLSALRDGKVDSHEMVELRRRAYDFLELMGWLEK